MVGLMLQKTLITFARNKIPILAQVFCPILWCLCIAYMNSQGSVLNWTLVQQVGPVHDPVPVGKCVGMNCISIGYSIIGDSDPKVQEQKYTWIDEIMRNVAGRNNLVFQKDVKKLTVGPVKSFTNYLENNPNQTQYSVVWCTDAWTLNEEKGLQMPCTFDNKQRPEEELIMYTLWYNKSLQDTPLFKPAQLPVPKNAELIFLQESIDNSILQYLHEREKKHPGQKAPEIKTTYSDFPGPLDRVFKNFELMGLFGSYYLTLGPLLTFLVLL